MRLEVYANRTIPGRPGDVETTVVSGSVDDRLEARAAELALRGDTCLVVTRDIPLAERLVLNGVDAINDRGGVFDAASIAQRRSERDAAAAIRASGLEVMNRRRTYGAAERKAFADALDRYLTRTAERET